MFRVENFNYVTNTALCLYNFTPQLSFIFIGLHDVVCAQIFSNKTLRSWNCIQVECIY